MSRSGPPEIEFSMTRSHGRRAAPTEVANSNGNAGEANRTRDAWRVEALPDLRAGLGTPLATERERSGGKNCAICKEIWIPSEVLSQRNVRHFRQMAPAKWQMMMPPNVIGGSCNRLGRSCRTWLRKRCVREGSPFLSRRFVQTDNNNHESDIGTYL
jgi:hypothetical protein